jgi:hypothetical protein
MLPPHSGYSLILTAPIGTLLWFVKGSIVFPEISSHQPCERWVLSFYVFCFLLFGIKVKSENKQRTLERCDHCKFEIRIRVSCHIVCVCWDLSRSLKRNLRQSLPLMNSIVLSDIIKKNSEMNKRLREPDRHYWFQRISFELPQILCSYRDDIVSLSNNHSSVC